MKPPEPIINYFVAGETKDGRTVLVGMGSLHPMDAEKELEHYREYSRDGEGHNWTGDFRLVRQVTRCEFIPSNAEVSHDDSRCNH